MALRDLILGRKRRLPDETDAAPKKHVGTTAVPELAAQAPNGGDKVAPAPVEAPAAPHRARGPANSRRRQAAGRISTAVIDGSIAPIERCYAAVDRLGLVHDVAEVRLTAEDGAAGFIVAARQIVYARFVMKDGFDESFDFRPEPLSVDMAVRFCSVFAAFCARTQDLVIEEKPVAGVFGAEVGLAVADITFDEAALRAHLEAVEVERLRHYPSPEASPETEVSPDDPADTSAAAELPPGSEREEGGDSSKGGVEQDAGEAKAKPTLTDAVPLRSAAASDFPFSFLNLCRPLAEDVLRYTRAGADALPAGGRATDAFAEGLGDPALATWHGKLASALGSELVVIFVPAAPEGRVTVAAMDGESATAFYAPRQAFGGLCQTAIKSFPAKG